MLLNDVIIIGGDKKLTLNEIYDLIDIMPIRQKNIPKVDNQKLKLYI